MAEEYDDIKTFTVTAPTLTFDDGLDVKNEVSSAPSCSLPSQEGSDPAFSEDSLSDEEKKMVDEFSKKIDISNSQAILLYGSGTQQKMAGFSESALKNVRNKDMGEVGDMLSGLVTELRSFDVSEDQKGLKGFFKKSSNRINSLKAKYEKTEASVNSVCKELEQHQMVLMKDIALLDKMYDANLAYYKELSMYILAGKKKLAKVQDEDLKLALEKAERTNLPEDAQAARDLQQMCDRFDKKIHDLELTRTVAMQTAPQIRLIQNNDTLMAEKIQSTLVNTIPLWKSQMVLALGIEHSNQAAKAQREVTDMTNELLKKNADVLKSASVETAKEAERGVVDIETLKHTNETLISTFDEVLEIQTQGREKRRQAEEEMLRMEQDLKNKLLEISSKKTV